MNTRNPMYSHRISRLTSSLIREILQIAQRPEVISFAGGLPSLTHMPAFDTSSAPKNLLQYGPTEGEMELRIAIAKYLCALGRECVPEQVLITSGSQQGLDLVTKLFIDDGTAVALESPTYLAAIQAFSLFGARFFAHSLFADGIDPETLELTIKTQQPAFVYLIPTFQNPSGYCYSLQKRQAIAHLLDEHGIPLVEDDPYRELMYDSIERTPISALLNHSPWIYLGSFSKIAWPGIRVGYIASSPHLFPLLMQLKLAADLHTNRLGQWWATNFLLGSDYDAHILRLRASYRALRDAMQTALQTHFHDLAEWSLPPGGLFFWIKLKNACDTRRLLSQSLARNVVFMPGEPFFSDNREKSSRLRLNFSHATSGQIAHGIAVLAEVIRESACCH